MGQTALRQFVRSLRQRFEGNEFHPENDHELLRKYLANRDEAAFAALVRRHGPMVWNVCRRATCHHQDAEDAFQATFIVLTRKAPAVRWRASIAPWLYRVAQNLAKNAQAEARRRPGPLPREPAAPDAIAGMSARDLLAALDQEVSGLPERYRGPLVLCWLEGQTQEEAARLLSTSLSTLRRRLEFAQGLLRSRLTRRGLAPALALGSLALAHSAEAMPAVTPIGSAAGITATEHALALADGLIAATGGKLKIVIASVLLACAAAAGSGVAWYRSVTTPPQGPQKTERPTTPEIAQQPQRLDALSDPLPPGALLRLGTVRFRQTSGGISVAFSPVAELLASGGRDGAIVFWDPATGRELRRFQGDGTFVQAVAISPDGKLLAGGGKAVHLWNISTGAEVRRLNTTGDVYSLAFSPRGDLLATAGQSGISLWEVGTAKAVWTVECKESYLRCVAFAADGRTLAAGGSDKTIGIWRTDTGELAHRLRGHRNEVSGLAFSKDGKRLVSAAGETFVWDTASGKQLPSLNAGSLRDCVALSPDGRLLAIGGGNGDTIHLWDWAANKQMGELPQRDVRALTFSGDGKTLAAAGNGIIRLWDPATRRPRGPQAGHQEILTSVAYSPDGRTAVTGGWDGTTRIWETITGKELRRLEVPLTIDSDWRPISPANIGNVVVSQDGRLIGTVRGDRVVAIWDPGTGKEVYRFPGTSVAFSPDGKLIACGANGPPEDMYSTHVIAIYDRATGQKLRELRGHLTEINSLSFMPDEEMLISQGLQLRGLSTGEPGEKETRFFRLWNVATGKELAALPANGSHGGLCLSPDGRMVALSLETEKGGVTLWETVTRQKRIELAGGAGEFFGTAVSRDGRTLATAGLDGTVRLWDCSTGQELARLQGHRSAVYSVAFSPDGTKLISGSGDTTALIWDVNRFTQRRQGLMQLSTADLETSWHDLAGEAGAGYRAIGRLVSAPASALGLLRERLKPAPPEDPQIIARLIADLDSKEFKSRELAMRRLEELGEIVRPALQKMLAGDPPLEQKQRLALLIKKLEGGIPPTDILRQLRAVEVLERINNAEARELIRHLASGDPEAGLTRAAKKAQPGM